VEGGGVNSALEAQKLAMRCRRATSISVQSGANLVAERSGSGARSVYALKEGNGSHRGSCGETAIGGFDTCRSNGRASAAGGENESQQARGAPLGWEWTDGEGAQGRQRKIKMKTPMPRPSQRSQAGDDRPVISQRQNREQRLFQAPEATVTILSGMTTYKMHASDTNRW